MKKWICTFALFAFVGCASSKKQESASTSAAQPAPTAASAADTKTAKENTKKGKKTSKAAKSAENAEATSVSADASGKALQCANGSDKRTLEVKTTDRKGCELHYTKMESTQTIATQVEGHEKCVEVQERIKGKLEAAGFTCS